MTPTLPSCGRSRVPALLAAALLAAGGALLARDGPPPGEPAVYEGWTVVARPGQFGRKRDALVAGWDAEYGPGGWKVAYELHGRLFSREVVLLLYEDAYVEYLRANPDVLDWLCATASDVYDNAQSNVASGFDYRAQEARSNHIQDIAIRRALVRLGRWFEGDHLVEVRGRRSEGGHLSPGKLPFHRPEWIRQPAQEGWWERGSIEDFYQSNKVIVVPPR